MYWLSQCYSFFWSLYTRSKLWLHWITIAVLLSSEAVEPFRRRPFEAPDSQEVAQGMTKHPYHRSPTSPRQFEHGNLFSYNGKTNHDAYWNIVGDKKRELCNRTGILCKWCCFGSFPGEMNIGSSPYPSIGWNWWGDTSTIFNSHWGGCAHIGPNDFQVVTIFSTPKGI